MARRIVIWAVVAAALAGVFAAYLNPHLVVDLANGSGPVSSIWTCHARRIRPFALAANAGPICCAGGRVLDLAVAAAGTCAGWSGEALTFTGIDRDAAALAASQDPGRRGASRVDRSQCRERRVALPGSAVRPPSWSPTTCGARSGPQLLGISRPGRLAGLRDLLPAAIASVGKPSAARFPAAPGELLARCTRAAHRGLRGRLSGRAGALVQRVVAQQARALARPAPTAPAAPPAAAPVRP